MLFVFCKLSKNKANDLDTLYTMALEHIIMKIQNNKKM